jgi:kinesin family member 5
MHISTASIHLKPQNLLTGQESMYGDTSSQHNHQRQESAYGDKQSEISSNIDRVDR